jgi:peptidoglycan/LPS O-acetylase OafA/YrhL
MLIVFFDTATAIAFCCLIFWAACGVGGPIGRFMESQPVLYVGKISYGLYVYHPFMAALALWMLLQFGLAWRLPVAVLSVVLTIGIASVSWHFFEKPINDLKRYF